MTKPVYSPDPVAKEKQRRICVALWAYAYEIKADSIVPDSIFDSFVAAINPEIETGNLKLDEFFKTHFDSCTGQWIHKHPEFSKIEALYNRLLKV